MTVIGSREWYSKVGERFGVLTYLYAERLGEVGSRQRAIEYIKANNPAGVSLVFRIG
nr:hypothetical protein [Brevibacillus laterosporus]